LLFVPDCVGYVYLWYDSKRRMFYLGSHYYGIKFYLCGSSRMRMAYNKRPHDFKRRILFKLQKGTKKDLQLIEQKYLDLIKIHELGIRYYNLKKLATGGNGGARKGQTNTEASNKRRSESLKGRKKPPGHGDKLRAVALTRYKIPKADGSWTWGYRQPLTTQTC